MNTVPPQPDTAGDTDALADYCPPKRHPAVWYVYVFFYVELPVFNITYNTYLWNQPCFAYGELFYFLSVVYAFAI